MSGEKKATIGHVDHGPTFKLMHPRTPEEYEAAERMEAHGLGTLNPDGTITLNEKGETAFREFADAVLTELEALNQEGNP